MSKNTTINFDKIITAVPVDRTAAVVASGMPVSYLTLEQQRESIVAAILQLEKAIKTARTANIAKCLGLRMQELQLQIREINNKLGRDKDSRSIEAYFMDIAKERLPAHTFRVFKEEAWRRHNLQIRKNPE